MTVSPGSPGRHLGKCTRSWPGNNKNTKYRV